MDAPLTLVAAAGNQTLPAVAGGPDGWLVAWEDSRGPSTDVYAGRVGADGSPADGGGFIVSLGANAQQQAAVARGDAGWLVVWNDDRGGSTSNVWGARVAVDGTVRDPSGIRISSSGKAADPAVAFDGQGWLVAWEDVRSGTSYDIYAARVSLAGAVLDPSGIAVSRRATGEFLPAIAFDGQDHVLVWQVQTAAGDYDLLAARVTPAGVVLDTTAVSPELYAAIRSFLERRSTLVAGARDQLATQFGALARRHVGGARDWRGSDEGLLEAVVTSYRARYQPGAPDLPAPPPT
jgi:hypothetical protein